MKKMKKTLTSCLFSSSSYLSGAATVINLGGNFYEYNRSESELEADYWALKRDFEMVGRDINEAFQEEIVKSGKRKDTDCILEQ